MFVGLRWAKRIGVAAFLVVGMIAWTRVAYDTTNAWVKHVTRALWTDDVETIAPREVAIVPGVLFSKGKPVPALVARLDLALSLYRAGRVKSILISGDEALSREVSGMRAWLIARGVRAEDIMADELGRRTLATMTRAAAVFGVRDAIVCTQRDCVARALFLARGAGIDAIALVPKGAVRTPARIIRKEGWKTTLAFVERYVLGRLAVAPHAASVISMGGD